MHATTVQKTWKTSFGDVAGIFLIFVSLGLLGTVVILSTAACKSDPLEIDTPTEYFVPDAGVERSVQSPALQEAKAQRLDAAPEDSNRFHLTFVRNTRDDSISSITRLMFDSANLRDIRSKVHFHDYRVQDPLYIERLSGALRPDELPGILMQDASGAVVYKATNQTLPKSSEELAKDLKYAALGYKSGLISGQRVCPPGRRCPQPVEPDPYQPLTPNPQPDIDQPIRPNRMPWAQPTPQIPNLHERPIIHTPSRPIFDLLDNIGRLVVIFMGFVVVVLIIFVIGLFRWNQMRKPF